MYSRSKAETDINFIFAFALFYSVCSVYSVVK
jgi:hypothetical protein